MEADPPQVTFRWGLNSTGGLITIKSVTAGRLRSIATFPTRLGIQYGQLLCWATNKFGEQLKPCIFNIIPGDRPTSMHNCIISNQSTDSLTIQCQPGDDGGLSQIFHLEIFNSVTHQLINNLTRLKTPLFEISSLPKSTPLRFNLYSSNEKGQSDIISLSDSTMPLISKGKCRPL